MVIMRLPAKWDATADSQVERGPGGIARPDRGDNVYRPADELLDLYAVVLIAVPLGLFLKWLWP